MTRVTKDPETRRQEILEAAMSVFAEKGYDKTKMSDIAVRAGVAQGLCYRYFPSKEVLLDRAVEQYAQLQTEGMRRIIMDPALTLVQKIQKFPSFMEAEKGNGVYDLAFHTADSKTIHNQLTLEVCEIMKGCVEEVLRTAADKGEITVKDPETLASFAVYGQIGILLDDKLEDTEKVERLRNFLMEFFEKSG